MIDKDKITITLEEYKELLIIKGKYEELKSREGSWIKPTITWREYDKLRLQYKSNLAVDNREIEANKKEGND